MANPRRQDFDSYFAPLVAIPSTSLTAGGAGDNVEVDGPSINRITTAGGVCDHLTFIVQALVAGIVAADATLSLKGTLQDSADGSSFSDVSATLQPSGAAEGLIGSAISVDGSSVSEFTADCRGLRQFVRLQLKPDLSAAGTDTATVSAIAILAGSHKLPV